MKIDGKRLAETHPVFSSAVLDEGKRDELTTPRLLARPEQTGKLIPTAQSESKEAFLPSPLQLDCLPYPALSSRIKANFPDTVPHAGIGLTNDQPSGTHGTALSFDEQPSDQRIIHQHKRNLARHFTDTWPSRLPFSEQRQFEQGSYVLVHPDGETRPCTTYRELAEFVANRVISDMPERLLHVAGPQLPNFLCQTYLYNPALCLFGHVDQRRIEPLANLCTMFEVARSEDGEIRVRYTASDDHVDRVILVGPGENDEHEAALLAPASILFRGTLLFASDGACAVGPVQIRASAIHLPRPQDAP